MEPQRSAESKLDDVVHRFLDEYFKLSDIRERTTEYVNMFTEDAAFILDSQPCKGTEAHDTRRIRRNNPGQVEIHGSVDLELLDGQKKTLVFTSKGHLTTVESEWGYRWDSYQVFINLAALT
ncbi:hypothetical protein CEP54_013844 [Fusarium duplospermum]|uniref:SnoaL-like domain-containing protein n=1 Tax=Fusarium duplospermum TaxID=1325734 RepID=A0A428P0I2_9HYPO|nr:hypothetical protein CEP54_013844 [Fusarium duplospermum]